MNSILPLGLLAAGLIGACTVPAPPPPSAISSPASSPALAEELATYLAADFGPDLEVDYELLRDIPTQVGVAVPKYYLWFTATRGDELIVAGAARVAAAGTQEAEHFTVLNVVSQAAIAADPEQLNPIFPAALIPAIRQRAGVAGE